MDRRHLSIERVAPSRYLADKRSGLGHGSSGSKAPAPASVAQTPRKNVPAVASLARRRGPAVLASLLEQPRTAHFGDFALAGNHACFIGECECHPFFLAEISSR